MKKHLLELSDDALIEGYRAGDTQCFDVLLERYSSCILYTGFVRKQITRMRLLICIRRFRCESPRN